ncbi:MAG: protoheme IX farnesyltransferase [Desulfovibrio sp.]
MATRSSSKNYLKLTRFRISLSTAIAAMAGFLLFTPLKDSRQVETLFAVMWGCFLLTAGLSALNQLQEYTQDAKMKRTADRPLPAQTRTPREVMFFGVICTFVAVFWAAVMSGTVLALIFIAAFVLYNGCYTPMKTKTSLALPIGAIAGALPILAGWVAAGGNPLSFTILNAALVLFLWQGPHYMLLAKLYKNDFDNSDIRALQTTHSPQLCKAYCILWGTTYALAILSFAFFTPKMHQTYQYLLCAIAFMGPLACLVKSARSGFFIINISLAFFLLFATAGRLLYMPNL